MVRSDGVDDGTEHEPAAQHVSARIDQHHDRHPLLGQIVGVGHEPRDVAVVPLPDTALELEGKPVLGVVSFGFGEQESLALALQRRSDEPAFGQGAGPDPDVAEVGDHPPRCPGKGHIPIGGIDHLAGGRVRIAAWVGRRQGPRTGR